MRPRGGAAGAAGAIVTAALVGLGCAEADPVPWDSLRVVVGTDVKVPDELDGFAISVERDGVPIFSEKYDAKVLASLPDSVVIINEHPNNDSPEKQLESVTPITITVTGFLAGVAHVSNSAKLRFNRGQLQLPLPLCQACIDKDCDESGMTCKRGVCEDPSIGSASALPDDDGTLVDPLAQCGPGS